MTGGAVSPATATPPPRRGRANLRALRVRNFGLFWAGQLVSGTGTWMQTVAMAWLVLQISHSPVTLATVTALQFLPMLLFSLPAGALADRVDKRRLLLVAQSLALGQALLLGVLVTLGTPQVWQLGVLAVALGASNALNNPAQQAFVSELVSPDLVAQAVALNSAQFNAARMVGSALGGVAVAYLGVAAVFYLNAASFAATLAALLAMKTAQLRAPATRRAGPGAVREGLRYARHTPPVLFVLATLAVVGTFGFNWPVAAPLIAREVLNLHAVGFGTLMGAFGAGALAAALGLAAVRGGSERRIVTAGALLAVVLLLLGWSHSYPISVVLMAAAGATGTVFTTTANSRLQLLVPDQLRGRVMSLFVLLMAGTTPIGTYLLGHVAAAWGVPASMTIFGVATVVGLSATIAYRAFTLRRSPPPVTAPAADVSLCREEPCDA
jgi:MFS family permease